MGCLFPIFITCRLTGNSRRHWVIHHRPADAQQSSRPSLRRGATPACRHRLSGGDKCCNWRPCWWPTRVDHTCCRWPGWNPSAWPHGWRPCLSSRNTRLDSSRRRQSCRPPAKGADRQKDCETCPQILGSWTQSRFFRFSVVYLSIWGFFFSSNLWLLFPKFVQKISIFSPYNWKRLLTLMCKQKKKHLGSLTSCTGVAVSWSWAIWTELSCSII